MFKIINGNLTVDGKSQLSSLTTQQLTPIKVI